MRQDREGYDEEAKRMEGEKKAHLRYLLMLLVLVLFLFPAGYLSVFTSTLVHEVFGHGLMAISVGGDFTGLKIEWDGSGSANATAGEHAHRHERALVDLAGIFAGMLAGLASLGLGYVRRLPFFLRLWLLVFASDALLGNSVYLFWNGIYTDFNGDVSNYLVRYGEIELRMLAVIIGGGFLLFFVALTCHTWYTIMCEWLGSRKASRGYELIAPLVLIFVVQSFRWLTNDLLYNVGAYAIAAMTLLTIGVLVWLYIRKPRISPEEHKPKEALVPIIVVSTFAGIACAIVFFLLSRGLNW